MLLGVFTVSCDGKRPLQGEEGFHTVTINNRELRRDVAGEVVDAHDGCLQFFEGRYYLYGTAYGKSDGYGNTNRYRVYSSPDLESWTLEGELLKERPDGVYYRPYVVFNPKTRKYVLWYNWYPKLWNGQVGVATSDTPVGPFTIVNPKVSLSQTNSYSGDGSLFVDDDGTGYFIHTAIDEGYAVRVARLTPDYMGLTGETSNILAKGAEAPLLFRRNNLYYALCGNLCAFCPEGSGGQVFIANSPLGPYLTKRDWHLIVAQMMLPSSPRRQLGSPKFPWRGNLHSSGWRIAGDQPLMGSRAMIFNSGACR
ncbi:MAG: family 43 glycosylhydrolase [Limisphaerales bacterium]